MINPREAPTHVIHPAGPPVRHVVNNVKKVTKESLLSDNANPFSTALVVCIVSFILIILCLVFIFLFPEARLSITTLQTFRQWEELKQVFMNTTSIIPVQNPSTLLHASFSPRLETLDDYQDLVNRGILTLESIKNVTFKSPDAWKSDPSLLQRLMVVSWCAYPNALESATPTTRNGGCKCIASRYQEFVLATVNMTANITLAVREKYALKVLECVDQRQVSRTTVCGRACSLHPMGLMLYANEVLFLISLAYLIFSSTDLRKWIDPRGETATKIFLNGVVVVFAVVLVFPFIYDDWRGNLLNIVGLVLCVWNLLYSLRDDLFPLQPPVTTHNDPLRGVPGNPHPLVACVLVNLPLILPAYTILLAISGFGRDTGVVLTFGLVGGVMGIVLQRFVWTYRYADAAAQYETLMVLGGTYFCLFMQLLIMFVGYYNSSAIAFSGTLGTYIVFILFLVAMAAFIDGDRKDFHILKQNALNDEFIKSEPRVMNHFFSLTLALLLILPMGLNMGLTIMSAIDVGKK